MEKPSQTLENTVLLSLGHTPPASFQKPERHREIIDARQFGRCDPARFLLPIQLAEVYECQGVGCDNTFTGIDGVAFDTLWRMPGVDEAAYHIVLFCSYACLLVALDAGETTQ